MIKRQSVSLSHKCILGRWLRSLLGRPARSAAGASQRWLLTAATMAVAIRTAATSSALRGGVQFGRPDECVNFSRKASRASISSGSTCTILQNQPGDLREVGQVPSWASQDIGLRSRVTAMPAFF